MTEAVKGKDKAAVGQLFQKIHTLLTQQDVEPTPDLGKLAALSGVREFPSRVKCASLCWHTLNAALERGVPTGDSLAGRSVAASDSPVLLSLGVAPSANVDIVINLSPELPTCLSQTRRVAEIIDGDDTRRRAGRARFKAYRELGVQPASHNIRGD